jgi:outer membrane protein OmpA-like peptidoglycan-associated protein
MECSVKRFLLPLILLICIAGPHTAHTQSLDGAHPTPLSPGVNKGNVVNFTGNQYYYFFAGPGRFDVRMAFHEMGMLGNPFRQTLTIEFVNDAGKVVYHGVMTSQGNLAMMTTFGKYDERKRLRVAVMAQNGLVRMGGYYEFEATGAVSFDGKAGASANVRAQNSESLIKPVGPLIKSGGPLIQSSGGPLIRSGGPLITPSGPLVYPGQPLIVHETPHEVRITLAADVLFDFNRADLRADAIPTLRDAAARIKAARPRAATLVEGYTDAKGPAGLNLRLSQQRAEAVETWLIQNAGFSVAAFTPRGFGAARPVAPNQKPNGQDDPAGRQLNRRVEIVITR